MWISKISDGYLINIYDVNLEIEDVIRMFFSKYYSDSNYKFDIYVCENFKVIIIVTRDFKTSDKMECQLSYHLNSIFLYKIDFFCIDKSLIKKGELFFLKGYFYYYGGNDLGENEYAKLFELSDKFIIGKEAIEIYNNGIRVSQKFLYSD